MMPAYRSEAEAEVRGAVVQRLRELRPNSRIIHEINCEFYGNRIDVLAVGAEEIIAVEVKSAKDKLSRLPDQITAMNRVAHHTIAALHEKFLEERETNEWGAHYERDGKFWLLAVPDTARGSQVWVYPEAKRGNAGPSLWQAPKLRFNATLPEAALHMLWRDELAVLCSELGLATTRRSVMTEMVHALRWHCTGAELTRGICRQLRRRTCVEADPALESAA